MSRLLIATVLLACSSVAAQDAKQFVLAASRGGLVELIDPVSLETVGRIHVDLPPKSVGLNDVSASANGSVIYVEGPIASNPNGCCSLYSIDLATLRMNSTEATPERDPHSSTGIKMANDQLHRSPDGHWLFGVRSFRGPALDIYDVVHGRFIRQLVPEGLEGDWHPTGTWSGDRFYFYVSKDDGSAARLWMVSPDTTELGAGITVGPLAQDLGCQLHSFALEDIVVTRTSLFVYELFGFIGDRRSYCSNLVPGGAWIIDASNGQLLYHVATDLHFSILIPDQHESVLYGLSSGGPNWEFPVQLVRIDARDGQVLESRTLDTDRWHIAMASLRSAPTGDVKVIQKRESNAK
ncbi:MAG TPA: hypothetical protein VGR71_14765 [Nitrospira sp.]|nr:hypothetical protein [Nitrospira sp.]